MILEAGRAPLFRLIGSNATPLQQFDAGQTFGRWTEKRPGAEAGPVGWGGPGGPILLLGRVGQHARLAQPGIGQPEAAIGFGTATGFVCNIAFHSRRSMHSLLQMT